MVIKLSIGKRYLTLFLSFLKIGMFTFGGGYAMIALIEREFVERRGWITHDEFINVAAIAESTPGPIAVNSATYIGYKVGRVPGSIIATAAVCLPSFIVIYIISLFFDAFLELEYVSYAFKGIQICVAYLIISAGLKMLKKLPKTAFNLTLLSLTVILMLAFSLFSVSFSSIFFILIGALAGVTAYGISLCIKNKQSKEQDHK